MVTDATGVPRSGEKVQVTMIQTLGGRTKKAMRRNVTAISIHPGEIVIENGP